MRRRLLRPTDVIIVLVLVFLMLALPAHASKKKDLQKEAKAAEQRGDVESAQALYCELAKMEKEKGGLLGKLEGKDQTVIAKCDDYTKTVETLHQRDADSIAAGKAALAQRRFEDANRAFQAVTSKQYHDEAARYLTTVIPQAQQQVKTEVDARERQKQEEQARITERYNQGVAAYQHNDFDKARSLLTGLTGSHSAEALQILSQIQNYTKAFQEAAKYDKAGKYKLAVESYKRVLKIKADGPWDVRQKLARAEAHRSAATAAAPRERVEDQSLSADDQALADAITDFYGGDYQPAESKLAAYSGSGPRKALASFYLGACELSRYFLSGAKPESKNLYDSAVQHFREVRQAAPGFVPPQQYMSPRILKVFNESAPPGF